MDIKVEITETMNSKDNLQGRQKCKRFKKFMIDILQGWFPSRDKAKFPKGVQQTRVINKKNDRYQKKIINEATGKVVVDIDEKLSEHKSKIHQDNA